MCCCEPVAHGRQDELRYGDDGDVVASTERAKPPETREREPVARGVVRCWRDGELDAPRAARPPRR